MGWTRYKLRVHLDRDGRPACGATNSRLFRGFANPPNQWNLAPPERRCKRCAKIFEAQKWKAKP